MPTPVVAPRSEFVVCSRFGPRFWRLAFVLVHLLSVSCSANAAPVCAGDSRLDSSLPPGASARLDGALVSPATEKPGTVGADANVRDASGPAQEQPDDLPCDVKAVVSAYCGDCHGAEPDFGAPMSLVSSAGFHAFRKGADWMLPLIEARFNTTDREIMMPPSLAPQPTATERAVLNDWLAAGALGQAQACSSSESRDGARDD
jgi:hypothetical protein